MVEPSRTCLGNRYELGGLLATGGMGQVWRAHDLLLGRPVAVKVLRSEFTSDPLFRARFRAEAQHAAALSHPNIAAVYDYGEEETIDGTGEHLAYLVMELVEGESLSARLGRHGPLTPDETLGVLGQTAAALAVAHDAGVVHRDVKPGNVLVSTDGRVKITDFGIAWSAGSVPLTQTGQVVGTAAYLSPEQAAGSHATAASDVYSLGMVGYECLTGHKAFEGENSVAIALRQLRDQPAPLPDEVPAGIRTLIEHALVKDPAHRWPDGAAFAAAVDDVRAGRPLPPVEHSDTLSFWLAPGGPLEAGSSGVRASDDGGGRTGRRAGDTDPSGLVAGPPATSVRQRVTKVLVPLVALLVGAGAAVGILDQLGPSDPSAPMAAAQIAAPSATAGNSGLLIDPEVYLDRPVEEVAAELAAAGLRVATQPVTTGNVRPGLVVALSPGAGQLNRGDAISLSYAVAPPEPAAQAPKRAPVESAVQPAAKPTAAARAESSAPTAATASGSDTADAARIGSAASSSPAAGGSSASGRETRGNSTDDGGAAGSGPATTAPDPGDDDGSASSPATSPDDNSGKTTGHGTGNGSNGNGSNGNGSNGNGNKGNGNGNGGGRNG